jgi:hypothetical protein
LKLLGNKEQLKGMLEIVGLYSNKGDKPAYFVFVKVNGKDIDLSNIPDEATTSGSAMVTAKGPYGRYAYLNDVDIFRDLAEAFPQGAFTAEISGYGQYEIQNLKCELKDSILNIETFFESSEEAGNAWVEDIMKKLSLKKFKKLFKIEGEGFDEKSYGYMLESMGCDYYEDLSEMEFDYFVGYLGDDGCETGLEENEFAEIMESKLPELGIVSQEKFSEGYEGGFTCHFVYDPVAKLYIGKEKPLFGGMSAGQVFNANEMIAAGLKVKGLPSDEDALANLPIEDAYAALVAGMGFDGDDEEDKEDDDED